MTICVFNSRLYQRCFSTSGGPCNIMIPLNGIPYFSYFTSIVLLLNLSMNSINSNLLSKNIF